jgi:hypothetical protein
MNGKHSLNHGQRKAGDGLESSPPVITSRSNNPSRSSGSSPTEKPVIDFAVRDEGTIWLFTPQTPAAFDFLSENIQEDAQYFGDSLAVEHRHVYDLLLGLREHALKAARG